MEDKKIDNSNSAKADEKYPLETPNNLKDFFLPVVEFFGILVPGLVFMVAVIPAAIIPLFVLFKAIYLYLHNELSQHKIALDQIEFFYRNIKELKVMFKSGFNSTNGMLFLVFSYVVGHIFYRQDIKEPYLRSFEKTSDRYKKIGPVSMDMYEKVKKIKKFNLKKCLIILYICFSGKRDLLKRIKNKDNITVNTYKEHAEFPYGRLKEYMEHRGLYHLARIIPWNSKRNEYTDGNYRYKSEYFISILKTRLEFVFPRQYIKIQKNEAHVRMMSSIFYVLITIAYISLTVFNTSILFYAFASFYLEFLIENDISRLLYFLYFIFPTFITFLISIHLKSKIEIFLHNQMLKEIVLILEMVCFADKLRPDLKILDFDS